MSPDKSSVHHAQMDDILVPEDGMPAGQGLSKRQGVRVADSERQNGVAVGCGR